MNNGCQFFCLAVARKAFDNSLIRLNGGRAGNIVVVYFRHLSAATFSIVSYDAEARPVQGVLQFIIIRRTKQDRFPESQVVKHFAGDYPFHAMITDAQQQVRCVDNIQHLLLTQPAGNSNRNMPALRAFLDPVTLLQIICGACENNFYVTHMERFHHFRYAVKKYFYWLLPVKISNIGDRKFFMDGRFQFRQIHIVTIVNDSGRP